MTKKEEKHEMRKWQILDIALTHFIRYGFYGTSTRKIAEEAGISSGLMFHYFPNKLALYEALVEIGCEPMIAGADEYESPLAFFEKQVEWFLSVATQNSFASRMFVFMGLVAINAKDISERATRMIKEHDIEALSVPYIEKGQKLGLIRQGDPLTLSVMFYSSIQGFAETLVVREDLKLPDKEWFLAILKNENNEQKGVDYNE
jgi:AcrR family transcriptional regulator